MSWKSKYTKDIEQRLYMIEKTTGKENGYVHSWHKGDFCTRLDAIESKLKNINEIFMRLQSIEEYTSLADRRFGDLVKYLDIERASTPAQMFYRKKGKKTK